jgi:hypothetical protein
VIESCLLWLNLFTDLLRFLLLTVRSKSSLAAENLFLRKQLALYQEQTVAGWTITRLSRHWRHQRENKIQNSGSQKRNDGVDDPDGTPPRAGPGIFRTTSP